MPRELYPGALEPIWYGDRKVYSVSGFVEGVRSQIVGIPALWMQGEISDFKHQRHLSLVYFTLKDPENGWVVRATMGRSRFEALGIRLADGDLVQVFGRPDIYSPFGSFQIRVQTVEHAGRGLLVQQLEALKAKLAAEGLFAEDRKRALPFLPRTVGLITGSGAAAQGDFLRNVVERFPPVRIAMVETLVQGERAAPQVLAALRQLERIDDVDVIVITRGGGAFEDFLPFSDERLCRAIAACSKPVVSAIGHEKDNPISDYVADLRVSTPTAAARSVVPDHAALVQADARLTSALRRRATATFHDADARQQRLRTRLSMRSPRQLVDARRAFIAGLRARSTRRLRTVLELSAGRLAHRRSLLDAAIDHRMDRARRAVHSSGAQLRALSPGRTMERGYAIVRSEGAGGVVVRDARQLSVGDGVSMVFARGGTVDAQVVQVLAPEENKGKVRK